MTAPTGDETAVERAEAAYRAAWEAWEATVDAETGTDDRGLWRKVNNALDRLQIAKHEAIVAAAEARGYERAIQDAAAKLTARADGIYADATIDGANEFYLSIQAATFTASAQLVRSLAASPSTEGDGNVH